MPTPAGSDLQALQAAPLERRRRAPGAHLRTRGPLTLFLASLLLLVGVVAGLALVRGEPHASTFAPSQPPGRLDVLATEFVRIALAFAQHKPDEVDSYFGPASLRPASGAALVPRGALAQRAHHLIEQLDFDAQPAARRSDADAGSQARQARLGAEARALATVIDEPHLSFDDEARTTYGMSVDAADRVAADAQIDAALAALDRVLPHLEPDPQAHPRTRPLPQPDPQPASAAASLAARFGEYRKRFAIPRIAGERCSTRRWRAVARGLRRIGRCLPANIST
jgi:hypothetical protein